MVTVPQIVYDSILTPKFYPVLVDSVVIDSIPCLPVKELIKVTDKKSGASVTIQQTEDKKGVEVKADVPEKEIRVPVEVKIEIWPAWWKVGALIFAALVAGALLGKLLG